MTRRDWLGVAGAALVAASGPALAQDPCEGASCTLDFRNVKSTTRVTVNGNIVLKRGAADSFKLTARLRAGGVQEGIVSARTQETATKGHYSFSASLDFSRYLNADEVQDFECELVGDPEGSFKDVKVSRTN